MTPSFPPPPPFPWWATDLAERLAKLGNATDDRRFTNDDTDEDRYDMALAVGMMFRPATTIPSADPAAVPKVLAWRLATVEEAREWRAAWLDWDDMRCVCGHPRREHWDRWGDDDEPLGLGCDAEGCDCAEARS